MSESLALTTQKALGYRRKYRGLIGVESKVQLKDKSVLSVVYTPGVAAPCLEIAANPDTSFDYTCRGNTIALVSDGSAVLELGNVGPNAALPVLEARSVIFKTFAGVDALPIAIASDNVEHFSAVIAHLSPTFGAICIDQVSSPQIFTLEKKLQSCLNIPVFANEPQGAAVSVLAGLLNALKIVGKDLSTARIVLNGAGAAGLGTANLLTTAGARNLIICDRAGVLYSDRAVRMNWAKMAATQYTTTSFSSGPHSLQEALQNADVFIGLSSKGALTTEMIAQMAPDAIVFALALPEPEIDPQEARAAGARIVATTHTGQYNHLDMALAFPGILRGALDVRALNITSQMHLKAAEALASVVQPEELDPDYIIPRILDYNVAPAVAAAVAAEATRSGQARRKVSAQRVGEMTKTFIYEGHLPIPPRANGEEVSDFALESLDLHKRYGGILEIKSKIPIRDDYILNSYYLPPGAADAAIEVMKNPASVWDYTVKSNLVAIVTDGSAVLGLGNIGPQAALPVMEGKAVLFHTFAGVEAFPICLDTQDVEEIITVVKAIAPTFGGVNLEDIAAPRCFEIEQRLRRETDIPIFHDDQHGTAVVVLAGMINALKLARKRFAQVTAVFNGAGAAGIAVAKLLMSVGLRNVIICDTNGAIYQGRPLGMNKLKEELAAVTNPQHRHGDLATVIRNADVFIGTSVANALTPGMVASMALNPIIFALANPIPEIMPAVAKAAGALIVATGRSDLDNQVNNSLVFPGIFRGALDVRARNINEPMKIAAAEAIAGLITDEELNPDFIIPRALDFRIPPRVAAAVAKAAMLSGEARLNLDPQKIANSTRNFIYEGSLHNLDNLAYD